MRFRHGPADDLEKHLRKQGWAQHSILRTNRDMSACDGYLGSHDKALAERDTFLFRNGEAEFAGLEPLHEVSQADGLHLCLCLQGQRPYVREQLDFGIPESKETIVYLGLWDNASERVRMFERGQKIGRSPMRDAGLGGYIPQPQKRQDQLLQWCLVRAPLRVLAR